MTTTRGIHHPRILIHPHFSKNTRKQRTKMLPTCERIWAFPSNSTLLVLLIPWITRKWQQQLALWICQDTKYTVIFGAPPICTATATSSLIFMVGLRKHFFEFIHILEIMPDDEDNVDDSFYDANEVFF